MKHPVFDRFLILVCALLSLCGAVVAALIFTGKLPVSTLMEFLQRLNPENLKIRIALIATAVVLLLFAILLFMVLLPARKKKSSSFAVQQNENGVVRISLKALENLVQKCMDRHGEIKVLTSTLTSDEESIRVDVHIALQSDISMPLAISALQKQIKRYIEACSGVAVAEVRVFVDSTIPATPNTPNSPYAIPQSLLGFASEPTLHAPKIAQTPDYMVTDAPAVEAKMPSSSES